MLSKKKKIERLEFERITKRGYSVRCIECEVYKNNDNQCVNIHTGVLCDNINWQVWGNIAYVIKKKDNYNKI